MTAYFGAPGRALAVVSLIAAGCAQPADERAAEQRQVRVITLAVDRAFAPLADRWTTLARRAETPGMESVAGSDGPFFTRDVLEWTSAVDEATRSMRAEGRVDQCLRPVREGVAALRAQVPPLEALERAGDQPAYRAGLVAADRGVRAGLCRVLVGRRRCRAIVPDAIVNAQHERWLEQLRCP